MLSGPPQFSASTGCFPTGNALALACFRSDVRVFAIVRMASAALRSERTRREGVLLPLLSPILPPVFRIAKSAFFRVFLHVAPHVRPTTRRANALTETLGGHSFSVVRMTIGTCRFPSVNGGSRSASENILAKRRDAQMCWIQASTMATRVASKTTRVTVVTNMIHRPAIRNRAVYVRGNHAVDLRNDALPLHTRILARANGANPQPTRIRITNSDACNDTIRKKGERCHVPSIFVPV